MDLIPGSLERTIFTYKLVVEGLLTQANRRDAFILWSRPLIPLVDSR